MTEAFLAAAAQFHVGDDVADNLATCLRIIDQASQEKSSLIVLPEFANHCSWYESPDHCFAVSVDIDGDFLGKIAQAARNAKAHVVINCTVRRPDKRVTGTSLLYSPDGELLGSSDKQVLIGHENDFLRQSTEAGAVVETSLGRLAMYSCMDGVINETPRCLALRGADILCNSLNSFALDEGDLHIPVRAAENKVWVIAANKVGPLIPEAIVGPVSEAINIPAHCLDGAGDSQIVAPDGSVMARAGKAEEIIYAHIDPGVARNKQRSDGTDIFASRRPGLYAPIFADPAHQPMPDIHGPDEVAVAAISLDPQAESAQALSAIESAIESGARLICLPSLACVTGIDTDTAVEFADRLATMLPDKVLVATSTLSNKLAVLRHQAVIIDRSGIVLAQDTLHKTERYAWSALGDAVVTLDTEYGRIGVLNSDDAIFPEVFRLFAFAGVSTVLIPGNFAESWEARTGLIERAAENRINIVSASTDEALIATLQRDFTIMTPWKEREFDGLLSAPEVTRGSGVSICLGRVCPSAAANKECSVNTHLVASRPWRLLEAMS